MPSFASVGAGVAFKGVALNVSYLISSDAIKNTINVGLGFSF